MRPSKSVEHAQQLLTALAGSPITTLTHLDLSYNDAWFKGDTEDLQMLGLLMPFIAKQTQLKQLIMFDCGLSAAHLTTIFTSLKMSSCYATLEKLIIYSNQFDTSESLSTAVAEFLAHATNLKVIDIRF